MTDFWVHGCGVLEDNATERLAARHPDWRFTDGTPPENAGYDVLVARSPTRELLAASAQLRTLVVPFAGVRQEVRDLLAGVPHVALRTVHHSAGPTAELAVALVLAAARSIVPADRAMRSGDWTARYVAPNPTMILGGHPALIVGYGEVGRRIARALSGLGLRVDAGLIAALPEPSVLVNVARAMVVDQQALYERLRGGGVAAGLDVWWNEPDSAAAATGVSASAYPFHELPNVVLSPHRGGAFSLREVRDLRLDHVDALLTELAPDTPLEERPAHARTSGGVALRRDEGG